MTSYFQQWETLLNDTSNQQKNQEFAQHYYSSEQQAYDFILAENQKTWQGEATVLAKTFGFGKDMIIFLGFLDGIQESIEKPFDLNEITDETVIDFTIDFKKLYWNMHEAQADWLYKLDSWDQVIPAAEREEIAKEYRLSKIVHVEKIGRNDPCTCGSQKKHKNCCGKGA